MAGGAGRLAGVAVHMHRPDIMFSATPGAGIAVDDDGRALVHAGAVIADMAVDLDRDRRVERRPRAHAARAD